MSRFIQIDEEGYFLSSGLRLDDPIYGEALLKELKTENRGFYTTAQNERVFVEAFDEPLVGLGVEKHSGESWILRLPYGYATTFIPTTITCDDWDRFHGRTVDGLPFVLSRAAQMQFFDLVDSFDDDSVTVNGRRIEIMTLNMADKTPLADRPDINESEFWSESYRNWQSAGNPPGWELGEVAKPLREVVPQIKIPKSRICILGCGSGHDAAFLAAQGHIVTAVDLSPEAIDKARSLYTESTHLKFITADAFEYAKKNSQSFDLVFEHTFFCAVDPDRRHELVQAWRSLLADEGHILAVFYVLDRTGGPPFGTSEWEVRQRLKPHFDFLYWTRWKTSIERRTGRELVVYAKKRGRSAE